MCFSSIARSLGSTRESKYMIPWILLRATTPPRHLSTPRLPALSSRLMLPPAYLHSDSTRCESLAKLSHNGHPCVGNTTSSHTISLRIQQQIWVLRSFRWTAPIYPKHNRCNWHRRPSKARESSTSSHTSMSLCYLGTSPCSLLRTD